MAGLGAAPDPRLFGLDKVADPVLPLQFRAGAEVGERSDLAIRPDDALLGAHAELQMASIADRYVAQPRGAFDPHARADSALAEDLNVGTDHAIRPDFDLLADVSGGGVDQRHTRRHQSAVHCLTDFSFHLCQLLARIDPGELRRRVAAATPRPSLRAPARS